MLRRRNQFPVLTVAASFLVALSGCGGGGGSTGSVVDPMPMPPIDEDTTVALAGVPTNHGLGSMDEFTIQPGASEEHGNIEFSCPAGGPACVVSVADDGSVQYERTGGMPVVMPALMVLAGLPTNHGLGSMDGATIQPGMSEERGNVELSCPAGGPACVVSVAADGSVQYERTGGMPAVMPALMVLAGAPANHGLGPMDGATIQPGMSEEHGNVELSCPAGGPACVVSVAADGSVQYERTGGMPAVMPALMALAGAPANHGLGPMDGATIQPGMSVEHGNVELSCPAGGPACVVSVAADGSVQYERTGGMPAVMPALMALAGAPANHGLGPMDGATIQPGMSVEHGNVELSCPAGGPACVVSVAADGSVQYERTGGMPAVMPALMALAGAPANHGLGPMDGATIQPGMSEEHGNVELSCPAGGPACVVSVAADGSVQYERTGGMPAAHRLYPFGLTPGLGAPIHAQTSGDTLAALLPNPQNQFPPLSSILQRSYIEPESSMLADNVHIASISSDGANGFHVTYVIGGEKQLIHFRAEDYGADPDCSTCYAVEPEESVRYRLWSHTDAFNRGTDRNQGSSGFRYFDVLGGEFRMERGTPWNRYFMVYGVRTEPGSLPAGTANYVGRMYARAYRADSPDINFRDDIDGTLDLTTDFASALEGRFEKVRIRRRDETGNRLPWSPLPDTTHFAIENGQIVDGRFTASLTGVDSNANAPLEETVRGYEGAVLGEFYGHGAEEVGGVLNAESQAHGRVMAGWFGGKQFVLNPRVPEGDLAILSAFVDWERSTSTTQLADTARVTAVESDGSAGVYVTYRVADADHRVHLAASDYGTNPGNPRGYTKPMGSRTHFLWTYDRQSFIDDPEFSYFNVNGWSGADFAEDGSLLAITRSPVVYGTPTESLPAGTAKYSGRMYAEERPTADPTFRSRTRIRSDNLTLTADFDVGGVDGMIDDIEVRAPDQSSYVDANGSFRIDNGAFANTAFTADLTGSQDFASYDLDMTGQFFGPGAAEVGGVLKGTNTTLNTVVQGWFGGAKQ